MPRQKTSDPELFAALLQLFREHGYEGASLSLISKATGLQRASLYHRFPGGKHEMALTVLEHVHGQFGEDILAPLAGQDSPASRVRKVAKKIDEFYEGGRRPCLLDAMSLGGQTQDIKDALAASMDGIADAFARIAKEAGHPASTAKRLGQDALVRLQGALVVARVSGDCKSFQRVVRELPELLTATG